MTRQLNLRQVADRLDIESWRVLRLSRFLDINAYDYMIQSDEVDKIASFDGPDARYCVLRDWLLDHPTQARYARAEGLEG